MDALQTLAITTVATLTSTVVTAYLTKIIETKHSKDLEIYKSQLQAQFETSKLALENEWQRKFFEYQTKYSSYHQEQAEKISEIYGQLVDTHRSIGYMIGPFQPLKDSPESKELAKETNEKYNLLSQTFNKNRIYFEEEVADKIEAILRKLHSALTSWAFSENHMFFERSADLALEAWDEVDKVIPPLLKEMERQFRQSLMPPSMSEKAGRELPQGNSS